MIHVTERGMASYTPSGVMIEEYFSRSAASLMCGLHADTLARLWRQSGYTEEERVGLSVAATRLFFSATQMESLLAENESALEKFRKSISEYHEGGSNV